MASSANFTLDDNEEPDFTPGSVSSIPTVVPAPVPQHQLPPLPRPISPSLTFSPLTVTTSILSNQSRDEPKSHVDPDLGISSLAQVTHVLEENQQRIDETEAQLQALMRQHARLVLAERLLEQQKVLDVLSTGPELGYDTGRSVASLLVYRCCLRWGCFNGDTQAASVLDNLGALLLSATDEDAILARTMAAARARAGLSSGGAPSEVQQLGNGSGGGGGGGGGASVPLSVDVGAQVEQSAVEAATREVAYWLAVTSTLLALVDPHLPLTALPRPGSTTAPAETSSGGTGLHLPMPLAAVAGDARASVARAASAAAAKVQEFQKRFSSMIVTFRKKGKGEEPEGKQQLGGAARAGSGTEQQLEPGRMRGWSTGEGDGSAGGTSLRSPSPVPMVGTSEAQTPAPSAPAAAAAGGVCVAPTYVAPRVAFRQQLDLVVQKTYMQMRDSLKRNVSAVLPGCVQQPLPPLTSPSAAHDDLIASSGGGGAHQGAAAGGNGSAGGGAAEGFSRSVDPSPQMQQVKVHGPNDLQSWWELISVLSHHLALLREAHVPRILIRCLFKQTLSFVDVQLFNQLLLRPECCSTSNARYLVEGLELLESWLTGSGHPAAAAAAAAAAAGTTPSAGEPSGPSPFQVQGAAGPAFVTAGEDLAVLVDDLRHIRQAAHFLVLANKGALRLDDFTAMCPALNMQQLYRLATTFWDDAPRALPQSSPLRPSLEVAPSAAIATAAVAATVVASGVEVGGGAMSLGGGVTEDEGEESQRPDDAASWDEEAEAAAGVGVQQPGVSGDERQPSDSTVMEAAEAAVAAAAAAAAADEAGGMLLGAPQPPAAPQPPEAVLSRNVSGEVLEEMKRRHSVANNGGLIVTFLLDDDSAPLIVQSGGGGGSSGGSGGGVVAVARKLLQMINEPRLHEGLLEGLPPALSSEDCPPQVFAFMLDGRTAGGGVNTAAGPSP